MLHASSPLVGTPLPPLVLDDGASRDLPTLHLRPRLMRLAYAVTALAMPAVGVFVAGPVRSGGAPTVPQATASAVHLVAPAFHPRLAERRRDIAQVASLGAAFGRVRR